MSSSKKLIIIKMGGSIITDKNSSIPKIRTSTINRVAKQLKKISDDYQIILVHGAGSFGHPLAKKYNLTKGFVSEDSKMGFAETAQSMTNLNSKIIKILNDNKLPAVGLSPRTFITQTSNIINSFNTDIIESFVKHNIIPVLYGDVVLDQKLGCSVLSGDIIISFLAKKLMVSKVIFLSDVKGVCDDDPKQNPQAKLIPEINNDNFETVLKGLKVSGRVDVTGEMRGKVISLQKNLSKIPIFIINGLSKDSLEKLLSGEKIGTSIYFN